MCLGLYLTNWRYDIWCSKVHSWLNLVWSSNNVLVRTRRCILFFRPTVSFFPAKSLLFSSLVRKWITFFFFFCSKLFLCSSGAGLTGRFLTFAPAMLLDPHFAVHFSYAIQLWFKRHVLFFQLLDFGSQFGLTHCFLPPIAWWMGWGKVMADCWQNWRTWNGR